MGATPAGAPPWHGIYPSTVLPMRADFLPDWDAYAAHTAACGLHPGLAGVLCNGHAGENFVLSAAEKRRAVAETVAAVGGHRIVVAGVNAEGSLDAAREAAAAMEAGADAVMVFMPNGFALSRDGAAAVLHHRMVADAVPGAPLFLFQGSHAARMAYDPATLDRLLELPGVVGIKEGGWEVNRYDALRRRVRARRPGVAVMASGDEHLLACMAHGSDGSMVSLAAIVPGDILALDAAVRRSDLAAAQVLHARLEPLADAIYGQPPGGRATARIKWCLHALGRIPCAAARPPVGAVDGAEAAMLRAALDGVVEDGPVFLFTVEDVFQIGDRGLILVPGISTAQDPSVRVGDAVMLETPAGAIHRTVIRGMERVSSRYVTTPPLHVPVLVGTEMEKDMVPAGTRVSLLPRA